MRRKAWVPVWAIIIASILIATQYGKVPPSQPSMIEALGLSYTMQGLLMTAFSASALVMALFGGVLIDRLGARRVVSAALVVSVVGTVVGMFMASDVGLLASRVLEGAGYGVTMTAGPVLIAAWYEPAKRGLVSGVWGANVGIGMLVSLGVANPILSMTDWTGMWLFSLASTVLAALLVAVCVHMPDTADRRDLAEVKAEQEGRKHGVIWGYAAPLALLTAFMFFLVGGATDAFNSFTITYLNIDLGHSYEDANLASMIASFGMLVGSVIVGLVFARVRDKGLVLIVNIVLCIVVQFAWFNLDASLPVMFAVAFLAGCALGAAPALFFAIPPFVARSSSTVGAAVALVVLGQNLGTLVVPTLVGSVLDGASYSAAALVMGGLSCVALIVAVVFRAQFRKREREGMLD
ncbi:MFS transporter [Gordonibacter sp.]|uniref:MFS transporter n=1 Tax=Gordonibacter sp. TaxID=1968902 RepID=UPI002FC69EEE